MHQTVNETSPFYPMPYTERMISVCTWTIDVGNNLKYILNMRFVDFVGPEWLHIQVALVHYQQNPFTTPEFLNVPGPQFPPRMILDSVPPVLLRISNHEDGEFQSLGIQNVQLLFWIQISLYDSCKK